MNAEGGFGNGDCNEMWEWQGGHYNLQRDLMNDGSDCLWGEAHQNVDDFFYMLDEKTPIKDCAGFSNQLCDFEDISNKVWEEGTETMQLKRRRVLQFTADGNEVGCSMTEDGLSESFQWNLDFSGENCALNCDGTDQIPEGWLVDCFDSSEENCISQEMNNSVPSIEQSNVSEFVNTSSSHMEMEYKIVQKKPVQARSKVLKGGRTVIRPPTKFTAAVAYPFALIKPCEIQGDVTLDDINQRIHAPPPFKIKHKIDDQPNTYPTSAISGKSVVHKTKIHTEGGRGSITITRTRG